MMNPVIIPLSSSRNSRKYEKKITKNTAGNAIISVIPRIKYCITCFKYLLFIILIIIINSLVWKNNIGKKYKIVIKYFWN